MCWYCKTSANRIEHEDGIHKWYECTHCGATEVKIPEHKGRRVWHPSTMGLPKNLRRGRHS